MKAIKIFMVGFAMVWLTLGLSSCNKWLDVSPASQIKQDDLLINEQGFKDALLGIYSKMSTRDLYADNMTMGFVDVLAQRYAVSNINHNFYYAVRYDYENIKIKPRIDKVWNVMYNTIANANNILGHIEAKKTVFAASNYNIIKGETLALRAFMHFDLLRLFAPAYRGGSTAEGIPYVKHFSTTVTKVSTVSETLTQIIADLKEAESLLEKSDPINNAVSSGDDLARFRTNRMNYLAVRALLARVYLFMDDKVNAALMAKSVVDAKKHKFITTAELTGNRKDRTFSTEHIFSLYITKLNEPVAEYFKFQTGGSGSTELNNTETNIKTAFEVSAGGSTDFRYVYLWEIDQATRYHSKFWQEYGSNVRDGDAFIRLMPLIRISEMFYILAECESNPVTAIGYINEVRLNRGLAALSTNFTIDGVKDEILKEYRKEFFSEGQLFYYYKRLNFARIPGSSINTSNKIYVLPIPDNEYEFRNK
uniref:RagB/SusD family nutrient uptake outer membrane protein n=1 Tax=Pedobacter schmidteae TaxID=2201271 RepID=UPI000EAD6739|nr:RagB/SusD family nutrient uptake outer membrane protein [Pedobacter schmidteae]